MPSSSKSKKSKQHKSPIYFEATGYLLGRSRLQSNESFNHVQAHELLVANENHKAISHCKIRCLTDGIYLKRASHFGSQPPTRHLPYKDIQRFFLFVTNPNVLILGVNEVDSEGLFYELLKLKDSNQVNEICDLIQRAQQQQNLVLTNDDKLPTHHYSTHSSVTGGEDSSRNSMHENMEETEEENQSNDLVQQYTCHEKETRLAVVETDPSAEQQISSHMDASEYSPPINFQTCANDHSYESSQIQVEPEVVVITQAAVAQTPSASQEIDQLNEPPIKSGNPIPHRLASDPIFQDLSRNIDPDDLWAVDMKYIQPDPLYGVRIADHGPIYMFVAHHNVREVPEVMNHASSTESLNSLTGGQKVALMNSADVELTTTWIRRPEPARI